MTFTLSRATLFAVIALAQTARADCYYDSWGNRRCSGLSYAVRVALGIAFSVLFFLIIAGLLVNRRRRAQRANMTYIVRPGGVPQPAQPAPGGYYASPYGAPGAYPPAGSPYAPPFAGAPQPGSDAAKAYEGVQYPQQSYSGYPVAPAYSPPPAGYDVGGSSVPQYAPPTGPPPAVGPRPDEKH